MIDVNTVYPCVGCKELIGPQDAYCKHCGVKQPSLVGRTFYNVFSKSRKKEEFRMEFSGIILDYKDILELARDQTSPFHEHFIGSYLAQEEMSSDNMLQVLSWIPITNGQPGDDQGPREIILKTDEMISKEIKRGLDDQIPRDIKLKPSD